KRLRRLSRATIGITPARHPRLLPQRRKKPPRAKNHGPRGKAGPGLLAARVYRERIIDRVCFRLKNHQSLRRRARRSSLILHAPGRNWSYEFSRMTQAGGSPDNSHGGGPDFAVRLLLKKGRQLGKCDFGL